ncbi:MAG TPA: hypothetical protein VF725_06410 [Ktedonobacterales bacterium]
MNRQQLMQTVDQEVWELLDGLPRPEQKALVGPRADPAAVASLHDVIEINHSARQTALLARINGHVFDPSWVAQDVSLEDIVLAYLGQSPERQSGEPAKEYSRLSARDGATTASEGGVQ